MEEPHWLAIHLYVHVSISWILCHLLHVHLRQDTTPRRGWIARRSIMYAKYCKICVKNGLNLEFSTCLKNWVLMCFGVRSPTESSFLVQAFTINTNTAFLLLNCIEGQTATRRCRWTGRLVLKCNKCAEFNVTLLPNSFREWHVYQKYRLFEHFKMLEGQRHCHDGDWERAPQSLGHKKARRWVIMEQTVRIYHAKNDCKF